jgi:hypothetical protein
MEIRGSFARTAHLIICPQAAELGAKIGQLIHKDAFIVFAG